VKISCDGCLPNEGCLRLNLSIVPWFVMNTAVFFRRVFGGLRLI